VISEKVVRETRTREPKAFRDRLEAELSDIRQAGSYREIRFVKPISATRILYEGKKCINLCSNSYLSLEVHPEVIAASESAVREYGSGTCSSRSVSGSIDLYRLLEEETAAFKGYPGALCFSNGYMANIGIISTLTDEADVIFSDELNHSSIIHSTRLSRAKKVIYRHLDMEDLEKKIRAEKSGGTKFVISETVFSMDGDLAPLADLAALKEKYGLCAIVDDAHGTGVFGQRGRGVEEFFEVTGKMDIHMSTFGKSLASFGAVVLGSPVIIDYLVNRARTFLYTTALPASCLAASRAALALLGRDTSSKDRLWANIAYMRLRLQEMGFDLKESVGPIVPLVVGDDEKAVAMQRMLLDRRIFLQAIRPPTVPPGTSRLRLTVVAGLSRDEMDQALEALAHAGKKVGLLG
jgi:8-amino-7-oxononanoate synthase